MQSEVLSETCLTILRKLLGIACFLLCAPFLIIILTFLYIYRHLVKIVLKIQLGDKFVGLLEGSDAIWSVEDDTSLSVINILLILKKPAGSTNTAFLNNVREFFNYFSKTVTTKHEKWFYYRYQKFGYYYWKKPTKFNPETTIRWLECENENCDGSCEDVHSTIFQENLSLICNRPLYNNHKPMWEILIGKRCSKSTSYIEKNPSLLSEHRFNTNVDEIPVIFRSHHSLCDGIALLKIFNDVIADKDIKEQSTVSLNNISTVKGNESKEKERTFSITKIVSTLKQIYIKIEEIARTIILILLSLEIFFFQIIRNMDDKSILHGQSPTGEKVTFFRLENDGDKSQILMKIKKIRQHTGSKFDDIILTAFAAGLSKYYSRMKEILPDAVSVIKPTRMSMPDEKLVLTNDFSINIIKTCFVNGDKENILTLHKHCRFFERLQKTASINNKIRNSLEAPFNFFGLKNLSGILPLLILKHFIALFCSTVVYSNIKGIQTKLHVQNHLVNNMTVLIPNINTTVLSLCVFTYEGNLNLNLLVDKAIIGNMELIREIMENTVSEIDSAYNSLA